MSMISSLIDELRKLVGDGSMEWVAGPVRASVLREAADTIWELRDDLQRAHRDNAKLREEIEAAKHDLQVFSMGSVQLEAENAKLRELVLYMWDFSCVVPDEPHTSKEELDYSVEVWKRMRELGVEVDA